MKVSIVGITGYSGLELVKILNNHEKSGTCFYSRNQGSGPTIV